MNIAKNPRASFEHTRYFPALDGLRALCVVLVMFNHVHTPTPHWINAPLGVDVFFVLSGFLITTLMLRERAKYGQVSLKAFYTRRFFRIIPVYYLTILLYAIVLAKLHDASKMLEFKSALPWLLSFMEEYRPLSAGNVMGHAWTLSIEEKFYLLWPLLLIWLAPFRGKKAFALVALGVLVIIAPSEPSRSYGGLLIGAVLAIALAPQTNWKFLKDLPAIPDAVLLLLVAFTYALNKMTDRYILFFSASSALLIASLVLREGIVRRFLELPPLVFIGKRSYALYLIHVLAINFAEKLLARRLSLNWENVMACSFVIAFLGACVMHVAIELPCIRLGRRLSRRFSHVEPISEPAT
jgi:peptidoglycan/LPS O-acetylase OafA/YrhL